jgi:hypothetical protein
MDRDSIIKAIKARRDRFQDAASFGSASDTDGGQRAQTFWEIAAEYKNYSPKSE